jgi:hypothetical protein
MKQPTVEEVSYLERHLTEELLGVEKRIKGLQTEAAVLRRHLAKAKAKQLGLQFIDRKNSVNRVLVENHILIFLQNSNNPIKSRKLYINTLKILPELKESTFRSYLHRLKSKGIITNRSGAGTWSVALKIDL